MPARPHYFISVLGLLYGLQTPAVAQDSPIDIPKADIEPASDMIKADTAKFQKDSLWARARLSTDARFRYQFLEQDNFEQDANSATLRVHTAFEFDISKKTTFLVEGEGIVSLIDDFNDGTGNNVQFPVIPDPEGLELNRLQLTTEIIPETRITLGRQRIAIDDSRFIGTFSFRQNDQTIDAIRGETRLLGPGTLDVGYFNRVNRPLGNDNVNGVFEGDSFFVNYGAQTPIGRIAAFHYSTELETQPFRDNLNADMPIRPAPIGTNPVPILGVNLSSKTTGVRILGRRHWDNFGIVWEGAFARQKDFADNPLDYSANYGLAELTLEPKQWTVKLRAEILGSGDGEGFQTPLGTLHKFQGFADQFLVTPEDGVRDYSAFVQYNFGQIGPFSAVKAFARHHWFEADTDGRNYGEELNLSFSAKLNRSRLALEFANYDADQFAQDNQAVFLTAQTVF